MESSRWLRGAKDVIKGHMVKNLYEQIESVATGGAISMESKWLVQVEQDVKRLIIESAIGFSKDASRG